MKIVEVRHAGLRGATHKGGWSAELAPESAVHTLISVKTDSGVVGVGSVFTSDLLVAARPLTHVSSNSSFDHKKEM